MKITKVYTRRGDKGQTSLVGGKRVSKSSVRLESYGTVDELSSNIGMLIAQLPDGHEKEMLFRIQNNLFNVCTNLATDQEDTPLYPSAHLPEGETELLEHEVDQIMKELPEAQGFILPGGTREAAQAHICRTVCRRAERRMIEAQSGEKELRFINRLSDYLFVLSRYLGHQNGEKEEKWNK